MRDPIKIVFLWHMHQPSYLDPDTGFSMMPWVRLHAIKDYYDMGRHVEEIPGAKAVFNFVPSLWEQLDKLSKGEWIDEHEIISRKKAETLSPDEKRFVAQHFFACQYQKMVEPLPEYKNLYSRFAPPNAPDKLLDVPPSTLTDIQVLFHLAWCGRTLRSEPFISDLIAKGSNFTYEEKITLLDRIRSFLAEIPSYYRKLSSEGIAEISATPFYHPILPLLLNPDASQVACPGLPQPRNRYPLAEDARRQILEAIDYHHRLLGSPPQGFWPSEGSVSPEVAQLFAEAGVRWIATDEEVLKLSLGGAVTLEQKCLPWSFRGTHLFFRHHDLSDRIGFVYQNMSTDDAVTDFMTRLREIRRDLPMDGHHVIPVILDGENCWEFYPEQGRPFLTRLYHEITRDPEFELSTFSTVLETVPPAELHHLHSGSWIYANFTTWTGDPIKNKAWSILYDARRAAETYLQNPNHSEAMKIELWNHIAAAEGSDWFWWFGEGHSSSYDAMFDALFRKRIGAIYRHIGERPPESLVKPLDSRWESARSYTLPSYRIKPSINGRLGSYWEWIAAGVAYPQAGSMQRSQILIRKLLFGFDRDHLYFRVESPLVRHPSPAGEDAIEIVFTSPVVRRIHVPLTAVAGAFDAGDGIRFAVKNAADLKIPFRLLKENWNEGDPVEFYAALVSSGREIERLPDSAPVLMNFPSANFDEENWQV